VTWAGPPEQHSCNESKKKLAVFVSGGGSNFKAIHTAILKGHINADVVVSQSCRLKGRSIALTWLFNIAAAALSIITLLLTGLSRSTDSAGAACQFQAAFAQCATYSHVWIACLVLS
jgi:hypothetical protein